MVKTSPQDEKLAQQDALIRAALPHVPFDGWSKKTLRAAAESSGIDVGTVERLFPRGAKDAVAHFMDLADRLMSEDLQAADLAGMKVRARVTYGVRKRLERWTPHREAVRRALALTPLPQFTGGALRGWYRMVDIIWKAADDKATDFNFYTKRGLLAAVYGSTLLFWLDDKSEDCAATWAFLDRRIADVMEFPKVKAQVQERLKGLNPLRIFERISERVAGFKRP